MDRWSKRIWWVILAFMLVAAGIKFLVPIGPSASVTQAIESREIVIYITGAVQQPGLLHLPIDARLDDALQKAGVSPKADLAAINPAQKLKDGQKILIPYLPETATEGSGSPSPGNTGTVAAPNAADFGKATSTKVNINTADLALLDTLPGVGPVLAQRILDYRQENGLFTSPEDLKEVSGIGDKTYEKMEALITVGP